MATKPTSLLAATHSWQPDTQPKRETASSLYEPVDRTLSKYTSIVEKANRILNPPPAPAPRAPAPPPAAAPARQAPSCATTCQLRPAQAFMATLMKQQEEAIARMAQASQQAAISAAQAAAQNLFKRTNSPPQASRARKPTDQPVQPPLATVAAAPSVALLTVPR
jgi:hypothetical protein